MQMQRQKREKKNSSIDSIVRVFVVLLFTVLVAFFVKTQVEVESMEVRLRDINEQVEHQRLVNKDLELSLRDEDEYLERVAREKLDYAHPEERVFVDASGVK